MKHISILLAAVSLLAVTGCRKYTAQDKENPKKQDNHGIASRYSVRGQGPRFVPKREMGRGPEWDADFNVKSNIHGGGVKVAKTPSQAMAGFLQCVDANSFNAAKRYLLDRNDKFANDVVTVACRVHAIRKLWKEKQWVNPPFDTVSSFCNKFIAFPATMADYTGDDASSTWTTQKLLPGDSSPTAVAGSFTLEKAGKLYKVKMDFLDEIDPAEKKKLAMRMKAFLFAYDKAKPKMQVENPDPQSLFKTIYNTYNEQLSALEEEENKKAE